MPKGIAPTTRGRISRAPAQNSEWGDVGRDRAKAEWDHEWGVGIGDLRTSKVSVEDGRGGEGERGRGGDGGEGERGGGDVI